MKIKELFFILSVFFMTISAMEQLEQDSGDTAVIQDKNINDTTYGTFHTSPLYVSSQETDERRESQGIAESEWDVNKMVKTLE